MFHDRDQNRDRRGIFRVDRRRRFGRGGRFGDGDVWRNLKGRQRGLQLHKPKWDPSSLTPFSKNFYIPHPDLLHRSLKEVEEYRARMKVTVKGNDIPYPIQYFEEGNFPTSVLDVIP